jgi:hypothetical protein
MITRLPMTAEHFDLIEPDPMFRDVKRRMNRDAIIKMGKAAAWVDTTSIEVLALAGFVIRCPGVAWMWFLPSARGSRMLVRVTRFFGRWVASLDAGIRVEAHVLADFEAGNRWAEMLGMERETGEPMRLWDGQHDYHLYARVTGENHDTDD